MRTGDEALVSVGIPTYNRSKLLRRALTGVVNQTLENIEIWVLDNASTDDTADVVASFCDERIHYLRNESNIGHSANATAALQAAYGGLRFWRRKSSGRW